MKKHFHVYRTTLVIFCLVNILLVALLNYKRTQSIVEINNRGEVERLRRPSASGILFRAPSPCLKSEEASDILWRWNQPSLSQIPETFEIPLHSMPYDRYVKDKVMDVLGSLNGGDISLKSVNKLMERGRAFRYRITDPYIPKLPRETEKEREGDCKDKALWLAEKMNDPNVEFVIGLADKFSQVHMRHAWLQWKHDDVLWVLDCTLRSKAFRVDSLPSHKYVPLFFYSKDGGRRVPDPDDVNQ